MTDSDGNLVSRYAYWIEDESFKLNVNTAQAALRGLPNSETDTHGNSNPAPSFQGMMSQDAATSLVSARSGIQANQGQFLSAWQVGHASASLAGTTASQFARNYKYLFTTCSSALNLSRTGAKRFNLNNAVKAVSASDPNVSSQILTGVGQIAAAINNQAPNFGQRFYRVDSTLTNLAALRQLSNSQKNAFTVPASQASLYVQRIAANIHDYISPLPNPTVLMTNGNLFYGKVPDLMADELVPDGTGGVNPIAAIGKKAIPLFQEYVIHGKLLQLNPAQASGSQTSADYSLELDHYFGFWNMSNKDITPANGDLGPNPFFALQNQPSISCTNTPPSGSDIPEGAPRDFAIHLMDKFKDATGAQVNLVFKANDFTVITTDPNFVTNGVNLGFQGRSVYAATALYHMNSSQRFDQGVSTPGNIVNVREYQGQTTRTEAGAIPYFRVNMIARGTDNLSDSQSKVLLGNDYGLLDAHPSVTIQRNSGSYPMAFDYDSPKKQNIQLNFFRGSYLGTPGAPTNGLPSGGGDPRGNLEPLTFDYIGPALFPGYASPLTCNQMDNQSVASAVKAVSNLGSYAYGQSPQNFWPSENFKAKTGTLDAPEIISNAPMQSIGELGYIYDPMRFATTSTLVQNWRGGGRTLTIGQPDQLWDGCMGYRPPADTTPQFTYETSPSRGWAAWRLCDIFTVKQDSDLVNNIQMNGMYNPNGILRDGGLALRTLLQGIAFSGQDTQLTGLTLSTSNMPGLINPEGLRPNYRVTMLGNGGQALANCLGIRLTLPVASIPDTMYYFSPLWEPGEISEMPIFSNTLGISTTAMNLLVSSVNNNTLNDRGHEEIYRRLSELITTKGNTFSIYIVGQALNRLGNPVATKARRVLIRLWPQFLDSTGKTTEMPDDNFDPTDSAQISRRFRAPDAYRIQVLGEEEPD